jgi:hypothetical protein
MRIIRAAPLLAAACGGPGIVTPERIAQLVAATGDGRTENAGTVIAVGVQALTVSNALAKGAFVSFVVERGGGSVTPATATVDAEGFASASWQLGTVAGALQSLVASAPGIAPIRFTPVIVGLRPPGAVAASQFTRSGQGPSRET